MNIGPRDNQQVFYAGLQQTEAGGRCRSDTTVGETVTLAGPDAYTVEEVIEMCEKYAGAEGDVTKVRAIQWQS